MDRVYQVSQDPKESQATKVSQDFLDYQDQKETRGWVSPDSLVTKVSLGCQDLLAHEACLVLENLD